MKDDAIDTDVPLDDELPASLLEALRALPSEQGRRSRETDAAVMARARETLAPIRRRRIIYFRLCPTLAAAACLIIALTLLSRPSTAPVTTSQAPTEDKYALILREVSAVFPEQVKAIIADGGELRISLADQPISNNKQAVVVELCEQNKCTTVITYVGQTVEVGEHRVTVRTDEKGSIVIDSPEFHGTGEHREHSVPGLLIKTRRI